MPRSPLLAVLLLVALAGCGKSGSPGASAPAGAASAAAAKPLLIGAEDLGQLSADASSSGPVITGSIQPEKRADLRAEVSAVVLTVHKENGEAVARGDLLVTLDDQAIRDSLTSAEEAQRAATLSFEQAERQFQRLKTLQTQGMSSMQAMEDAEGRRNNAYSELVAAKARVASARQQLERTRVRAPFAGRVSERRVSAGDTAQVGKELLKVIDPASMRFEGLVSADRMHELKLGQAVAFRINGYPNQDFAGKVRRIDAAANATTRQVEVLVGFADADKAPRIAGLYAEGRVLVETAGSNTLSLPESAVQRQDGKASAWVLREGALRRVELQLGERDARRGEYPVKSGMQAGERYLRSPGSGLVDGQKFELSSALASPAASAASGG